MGAGDAEPRPRGRDGGVTLGNSDFRFRPSIPLACGARLRSLVRMRAPSLPPSLIGDGDGGDVSQRQRCQNKEGVIRVRPSVVRPSSIHRRQCPLPSLLRSPSGEEEEEEEEEEDQFYKWQNESVLLGARARFFDGTHDRDRPVVVDGFDRRWRQIGQQWGPCYIEHLL